MKNILVFENKKYLDISSNIKSEFDVISIGVEFINFKDLDAVNNQLNNLCLEINRYDDLEGIVIPIKFSEKEKFLGLELGLHIRFTQELKENRFLPIIFLSSSSFEEILAFDINAYILTVPGSLLSDYNLEKLEEKFKKIEKINNDILQREIIPKVIINAPDKHHSIANEWGAYRLSQVGYSFIEKNWAYSLYTKFLLSQESFNQQIKLTQDDIILKKEWKEFISKYNENGLKILFIDDEKDKGWEVILREMFKHGLKSNVDFKAVKTEEEGLIELNKNIWDIVLIDLRLKDEEEYIKIPTDINEFSGGKLLIKAKEINPAIPVIIFTASTRAWNMEKLFEAGADGYYIKESPEFGIDNDITLHNWRNFIATLTNCLEKGKYLKWFWNNTQSIIREINKTIDNENIRKRIEEKLKIAFGILRMNQTEFDKKYLFTDFELAFLTYWSILNEIVADFYKDLNNDNWKIKRSEIYFLNNGKSNIVDNPKNKDGNLLYPGKPKIFYSEIPTDQTNNYTISIKYQIVGIIYLFYKLSNEKSEPIIQNILKFNTYRNHLDYEHSDFNTIRNKQIMMDRNRWFEYRKSNCVGIFELIYFLLTGDEKELKNKPF
jgi:CheY-like chemotaxis protein